MRKILASISLSVTLLFGGGLSAQILNVSETIQEQDQWCWAGVSKCVLNYYGTSVSQCEIADYARSVITWHDFGSVNCCTSASQGCNYWNYNWGNPGSIQDILQHFGTISNYGTGAALDKPTITSELSQGRPFIIRWGWYSGGGHFVVGNGIDGDDVHYMNPWFGEGSHIATYDWVLDDGVHEWTHTNKITTTPTTSIGKRNNIESEKAIYPNPSCGEVTIKLAEEVVVFDQLGKLVYKKKLDNTSQEYRLDLTFLPKGVYFIETKNIQANSFRKLILE